MIFCVGIKLIEEILSKWSLIYFKGMCKFMVIGEFFEWVIYGFEICYE